MKNKQLIKIAFLDRDGTLIFEPPDTKQIDSVEKLRILPGVIEGLKKLQDEGYKLVMVSNQDDIGTKGFSKENFEKPQRKFLKLLKNEGIEFYKIFICPHRKEQNCECRKPKMKLAAELLEKCDIDFEKSFMAGDRETDIKFAENIGIKGFLKETNKSFPRIASFERKTNETSAFIQANIDGRGLYKIDTGIKFFDHMLEQFSRHSLIDLFIKTKGDIGIDEHHTVEDTGITLGEALKKALDTKLGIKRYGFLLPMDETLAEAAIDLGGRPYLVFNCNFKREKIGDLPTELVEDFFKALSDSLKANIHINVRYGRNDHHKIEAIFKAFAKAMKMACERDPRLKNSLLTTKGII